MSGCIASLCCLFIRYAPLFIATVMRKRVICYFQPVRPARKPDQLTNASSSTRGKHFQHSHMPLFLNLISFFSGEKLERSEGCAPRGCSCLRASSRNIWTRSTVVFLPLRTALMRKFLVSHERRGRVAPPGCTSFQKKQKSVLWSSQRRYYLELFSQAEAHV